jgi:hypothetical protein
MCIEKDKFDRLNEKGVIVTQPHLNSGVFPWHTLGSGKSYFAHRITYFIYILSLFPFRVPLMKQDGHVCSLLRPLNLRSQKVKFHGWVLRKKEEELSDELLLGVEAFEEGDFRYATEATEDGDSDAYSHQQITIIFFCKSVG